MKYFFICGRYIYWGTMRQSQSGVVLTDAYIILETGPWEDLEWKTAEKINEIRIPWSAVEAWGATHKVLPGKALYARVPESTGIPSPTSETIGGGQRPLGTDDFYTTLIKSGYVPDSAPIKHGDLRKCVFNKEKNIWEPICNISSPA